MPSPASHTAILVFLREAARDARLKRWFSPFCHRKNLKGTAFLNRKAIALARQSGLSTFVIQGRDQKGDSFGERISYAIEEVFAQGFERVLVIGNDCLGLTSADIQRAASELARGKSVLGPDQKGGVYLIGLQRAQFDAQRWMLLPWQKPDLLLELHLEMGASGQPVVLLERKRDAGGRKQIEKCLADIADTDYGRVLHQLLFGDSPKPFSCHQPFIQSGLRVDNALRAPPTSV